MQQSMLTHRVVNCDLHRMPKFSRKYSIWCNPVGLGDLAKIFITGGLFSMQSLKLADRFVLNFYLYLYQRSTVRVIHSTKAYLHAAEPVVC